MFSSHVWQAARRWSEHETKIKQEREEENNPNSFSQFCRGKTQTGHIRKKNVWKSNLSEKSLGIIHCFVTQRCRIKGFSLVVLTSNLFHHSVKNNWHALLLIVSRRQESAVFLTWLTYVSWYCPQALKDSPQQFVYVNFKKIFGLVSHHNMLYNCVAQCSLKNAVTSSVRRWIELNANIGTLTCSQWRC